MSHHQQPANPDPSAPAGIPDAADPRWFRPPSRRERWMAAGLFVGFGVFFVLLFFVTAGFWFRWVTLGLGFYSVLHGLGYARSAARPAAPPPATPE
jgi:hypothetical protein